MDFLIRKATSEDFERVYSLFEQLWPNKKLNKAEMNKVYSRGVQSDKDELLCAVLDGKVIGFCSYAILNNFWQEGYVSYVNAMVIDEKYRGEGYGSKMIQEVIDLSKKQGMKMVELDSGFHREKAHEFYIKLGFDKRAFTFSYIF